MTYAALQVAHHHLFLEAAVLVVYHRFFCTGDWHQMVVFDGEGRNFSRSQPFNNWSDRSRSISPNRRLPTELQTTSTTSQDAASSMRQWAVSSASSPGRVRFTHVLTADMV